MADQAKQFLKLIRITVSEISLPEVILLLAGIFRSSKFRKVDIGFPRLESVEEVEQEPWSAGQL